MGFLIGLLISVGFGMACSSIAEGKGRSSVGWFLIGFLFSLFGLILLLVLPDERPAAIADAGDGWDPRPPPPARRPAPPPPAERFDARRWRALKEADPEVGAAAARVAALGPAFEDELAEKFLVLDDKAYLQPIERRVTERAEAERRRRAEGAAAGEGASVRREMAAYEAMVRANDGRDPREGLRVVRVEPYAGGWAPALGGIRVTLEDGSVLLRRDLFSRRFGAGEDIL